MTSSRVETVSILTPASTRPGTRDVAVEAPVAIEVNGLGYAVMMMTPAALVEFATGFMLTERLADRAADLRDIDIAETPAGIIVRIILAEHCAGRIHDRVRHRTSDTGCGLCGIAGLEQVIRPLPAPPPCPDVTPAALFAALASLRDHQPLNRATGAVHAAARCDTSGVILAAFEDVGRHNALDKLIGDGARSSAVADGFLLVTSRISFEMVDKALVARAPLLVGISAPTTLAIDHARAHDLTLVALARDDAMLVANDPFGIFTPG
ncbi:formate dehydrogenase accessory sulfurtransferase FdhD [Hephaestia sp. GCM10023244]|uniref:formate dehydrogenase accessory sulfurtransferase FdhD n=1 Tax=unclassified Hephaestia TaxID=2631281 RepID=UPI0020779B42|nr:formate dehydrogenase accessory sulfurtransferase FdhD [Hephaestia sp. MAHUQ-44]MCM8732157.1 formate dehydrogenase accessory sulfurtransferase FdhD [Hephaestia sp. MAHUQ-44]